MLPAIVAQLLAGAAAVILAGVKSLHFFPDHLTDFELDRQAPSSDHAQLQKRFRREWPLHHALRRLAAVVLTVVIFVILLVFNSAFVAVLSALAWLLVAEWLSARPAVIAQTESLLARYQSQFLQTVETLRPVLRLFVDRRQEVKPQHTRFYSKEELLRAVNAAGVPLTKQEKLFIRQAFSYGEKIIKDVMTPRADVTMVAQDEVIGPVLLDHLHKTGHPWFLVSGKASGQIAGILYAHDLLPPDPRAKHVRDLMDKRVSYLPESKPLDFALHSFLQTKRHLFIVVNESQEPTGVISIEDIIQQIIGRSITGRFETPAGREPEPVKPKSPATAGGKP